MEIATKIKNARNTKQLTQEAAADSIGVSRQTLSSWENGRSLPDIVSVLVMSDLYGVSLDELLKGDTDMKNKIVNDTKRSRRIITILAITLTALTLIIAGIFVTDRIMLDYRYDVIMNTVTSTAGHSSDKSEGDDIEVQIVLSELENADESWLCDVMPAFYKNACMKHICDRLGDEDNLNFKIDCEEIKSAFGDENLIVFKFASDESSVLVNHCELDDSDEI